MPTHGLKEACDIHKELVAQSDSWNLELDAQAFLTQIRFERKWVKIP